MYFVLQLEIQFMELDYTCPSCCYETAFETKRCSVMTSLLK